MGSRWQASSSPTGGRSGALHTMRHEPCPICAEAVDYNPRYPQQVCRRCSERATDDLGRAVEYSNIDLTGGICARYKDTHERYNGQVCYIDGIQCWADEAHMGGIVIQKA